MGYTISRDENGNRIRVPLSPEAQKAQDRSLAPLRAACDDARLRGFGKGKGGEGQVVCPNCKGQLSYRVSPINGHIQGQCSTPGCSSWMT